MIGVRDTVGCGKGKLSDKTWCGSGGMVAMVSQQQSSNSRPGNRELQERLERLQSEKVNVMRQMVSLEQDYDVVKVQNLEAKLLMVF